MSLDELALKSEIPHSPPYSLPDDKLLAQCRLDSFVASGPGGQHRNRTNTAVRATHLPTRISAVAADSRSHRENQIHAIRELRHKLAMELRRETIADPHTYRPPAWFADYPKLHMSPKNPLYPATIAAVLDVLNAVHWEVTPAAALLGETYSALLRFLHDDGPLWMHVNRRRAQLGMNALVSRH